MEMCEAADGSRESRHGEARPRRERKYLVRYPEWTSGASSTSGTSGYGRKLPYLPYLVHTSRLARCSLPYDDMYSGRIEPVSQTSQASLEQSTKQLNLCVQMQ